MKNKFIFVIFLILGLNAGCHEVTVGYLWLEDPGYNPDTLLVKQESSLNISAPSWGIWPNPTWDNMIESGYTPEQLEEWGIQPTFEGMGGEGEEYYRNKWDQPYVSTAIEGIEGTDQIYVSVKQITTDTGDAQKLKDCLMVWGDGRIQVPLHHNVPAGHYLISLNFKNEGYSKDVNDCFTIIVK